MGYFTGILKSMKQAKDSVGKIIQVVKATRFSPLD